MRSSKSLANFWDLPLDSLLKELHATSEGLNKAEAKKRHKLFGENTFETHSQKTLLWMILQRFQNPLILLLLLASLISALVRDFHSALLILSMVLVSIIIDTVQEYRASNTAAKLQKSVALRALVLRDHKKREISIKELVPGDIVFLSAGSLVPADGRLLQTKDLFVNQSLLTGESYPVEKKAEELQETNASVTGALNSVFMGSSVLTGEAQLIVCHIGKNTILGGIASTLTTQSPPTPFEVGTRQFGLLLMRLIVFLVLFVIVANIFFYRPWLDTILFALALGVGLAPEFLPMVTSITLARGAVRMARKQVIIKRLSSVHDLGSMNVLCTDKTGTLTEAKIQLAEHLDLLGQKSTHVLTLASLSSYFGGGVKSPLDTAILANGSLNVENWRKIDEMPFDFNRLRSSVLVDNGAKRLLIVKGAPEHVLAASTLFETVPETETPQPLDPGGYNKINSQFEHLSRQGLRVIGIAWREVPKNQEHVIIEDESHLIFAGFSTFFDPPKANTAEAMKKLQEHGIALKIVTGDSELVTQHLCQQLNIPIVGLLTGNDLQQMDDYALRTAIDKINLFCRVNPTQKNRIVTTLKHTGQIVGFMGDGINDAPALHNAHVSISVDSAVDVAKSAADIILLKKDLNVVYEGVIEGRTTYGNIMKYIMMMTSSNFGNMLSMAGAAIFLPFLPMLPTQILLNNLLYDLSEIAIPLDRVDKSFLEKPHRWNMSFIRNFMFLMGPISSLFDFLTFYILLAVFKAHEPLFQTGWFIESLATQILVIFIIRTRLSPLKSRPHPILAISSISLVGIGIILPYTPLGAHFGFVHLPLTFFAALGGLCIGYLLIAEVGKRIFYSYLNQH